MLLDAKTQGGGNDMDRAENIKKKERIYLNQEHEIEKHLRINNDRSK